MEEKEKEIQEVRGPINTLECLSEGDKKGWDAIFRRYNSLSNEKDKTQWRELI